MGMRWQGGRKSSNIEDRSGSGSGMSMGAIGGGGIGIVILAIAAFFFSGGDLSSVFDTINASNQQSENIQMEGTKTAEMTEEKEFASVVFAHLEDYWSETMAEENITFNYPKMVLFTDSVQSACGAASSQVGPFYCPADEKVYIDLSFADELANKYGATGDFAMAYVIAHEYGHHIQNELGTTQKLEKIRKQVSEKEYNQYSVRLELQADYYAGTFAKYLGNETYNGKPILETGDIEEAVVAANSIGDDTLQKEYQGYVVPDSFTHGTSAQRIEWFERGVKYGDLTHGDTFGETLK